MPNFTDFKTEISNCPGFVTVAISAFLVPFRCHSKRHSEVFPHTQLPFDAIVTRPLSLPLFHSLSSLSARDLNKGKPVKIGESIHKFCCYSFPLCPSEFFHNLNFPPSAKGVVGHFYKEVVSYDFAKGGKKSGVVDDQQIRHFTNIVWRRTTEVGCAQSKRNTKGCVYTVVRYRVEGSVGTKEDFKTNVHPVG